MVRRLLITLSVSLASACTALPDVRPFADGTAALSTSAGAYYGEINAEIQSLRPPEPPASTSVSNEDFEQTQARFAATKKLLDALFFAMTAYSEKVVILVDSGKKGGEAAQSLMNTSQGFGTLVGLAGAPISGEVAAAIKAIADEFTRRQSLQSLTEALGAADPGVQMVATSFEVIYKDALRLAADSIRNTRRREASLRAGFAVIGFRDNVLEGYDSYYRRLNQLVRLQPQPETYWKGFCDPEARGCVAVQELEAVGLVEARMEAIRPIVESYDREIAAIEADHKRRLTLGEAVVKGVRAWAVEHQKLRTSLDDGTDLDARNLLAALDEIRAATHPQQ
jgi:hypothetical protein